MLNPHTKKITNRNPIKQFVGIHLIAAATLLAGCLSAAEKKIRAEDTEQWEPIPQVIAPGNIPQDAIALFDGRNLDAWVGSDGEAARWRVKDNTMTVLPGSGGIATRQKFCDIQLHIEWRSPEKVEGKSGQFLGNSGVFLPGGYEVQVLDSHNNRTYSNGQAGSIYKQSPPLVNAIAPTGEWNTYDILFTAPTFNRSGELHSPAYVTVLHNGVVVQNHFEIQGKTRYRGWPKYKAHGCSPIELQDHGDKVSFRNIWVREI